MSGLVAILGGQEHQPGCEAVDRRLLAESGLAHPTVTVLLAATVPRRVHAKTMEALAYWPRLGARVRFAFTGGPHETERALAALVAPDLVVLTGGRPWRIHGRLTPPIVDRLLQLSADGVPLSGSSAGAMALCARRLDLRPGAMPRLRPGLGLVPGAIAPHYGRHATHHVCRVLSICYPGLPILGLPDRTALVGRRGAFEVAGVLRCTVLRGGTCARYSPGALVRLDDGYTGEASATRTVTRHGLDDHPKLPFDVLRVAYGVRGTEGRKGDGPTVLGEGTPTFSGGPFPSLRLVDTRRREGSDNLLLRYEVVSGDT